MKLSKAAQTARAKLLEERAQNANAKDAKQKAANKAKIEQNLFGDTNNKVSHVVGIDPSFREKGTAICVLELLTKTATFHRLKGRGVFQLVDWLQKQEFTNPIFAVENAHEQNYSFDQKGSKAVALRKARNAGANQAASVYIIEAVQRAHGLNSVHSISPKQKGTKWQEQFFVFTLKNNQHETINYKFGQKPETRQDERDAYQLICHVLPLLLS